MRNNPILVILIFSVIILTIDFYSYYGIKKITSKYNQTIKRIIWFLFWIVPIVLISGILVFFIFASSISPANILKYFHFISGTFILFYIPKMVFIIFNLLDDFLHLFRKMINKIKSEGHKVEEGAKPISRAKFLTNVGIVIAGVPFLSIAYGMKWGRFNFTVRKHALSFANFPAAFTGLKIVHISDFHIGSFMHNQQEVEEAVELINDQNADLLLFTGDFVNNVSSEINDFIAILNKLKAKLGKYSILGNHDYGEYVPWESVIEKRKNLDRLINLQNEMGFQLLLNDMQKIALNGAEIELLGVENWGLPPFPQYGDLNTALSNSNPQSFKILMTHDPTHWDEQVLKKTNIDLTLSGHTHGAQFGIEIPGWRWSPVNMRYKRWGGLYNEGKQHLYVNTGIGFIGFPGRVGMPPEITVIELKNG